MNNFNLQLILRKRARYFNQERRNQNQIKENLFINLFFYIDIYIKTFGIQIESIQLKKYDGPIKLNFEENELSNPVKKNMYHYFK